MSDFAVSINNKEFTWSEEAVKSKLQKIGKLNGKRVAWIQSDLSVKKSNGFTRLIWTIVAKHFSWMRKHFYGVDLNRSRSLLEQIGKQLPDNLKIKNLYHQAVGKFNQIAPRHSLTMEVESISLPAKMTLQVDPIMQFAKTHNCTISSGTSKFEDMEATNYPALKSFFQKLDSAGNTFKTGYHGLTNSEQVRRFEVVEFFQLLGKSPLNFTAILINGSYIDDDGAKAMASYISETDNLQVLDFHYSSVSEKGMKMIVNALKVNKSIVQINLRSNKVTPDIGEELLDLVKNHNHTIRQMGIVQRTSFPLDPKPSVELEGAIHAQIIENAEQCFAQLKKEPCTSF